MTPPDATTDRSLRLERTIPVAPERVFDAWTDPAEMRAWFAPDPTMDVEAEVDLRVGGRYRIRMGEHVVSGVYREVQRPERLAFTWSWESDEGPGADADMVVTVELTRVEDGTHLRLRHDGIPSEAQRTSHEQGWEACLPRLDAHLAAG